MLDYWFVKSPKNLLTRLTSIANNITLNPLIKTPGNCSLLVIYIEDLYSIVNGFPFILLEKYIGWLISLAQKFGILQYCLNINW